MALVFVFLGVSIFVHELGHFLLARKRGLKVDRFSIGFGPRIWGWKGKDGTDYRVSLLPLGGYVSLPQMADMEAIEGEASVPREKLPPLSFTDKLCVLLAGAGFNFIFAVLIATVLWIAGQPVSPETETTTIGYVVPRMHPQGDGRAVPSPAFEAGLKPGDKILAVDGSPVTRFSEITNYIMTGTGRAPDGRPQTVLTIDRDGKKSDVDVFPVLIQINPVSGDAVRRVGISPAQMLEVGRVLPGSPAEKAGLRVGDKILALDGKPLYHALPLLEKTGKGSPVQLRLENAEKLWDVTLTPQAIPITQPLAQLYLKDAKEGALSLFPSTDVGGLCVFSVENETYFSHISTNAPATLLSVNGAPAKTPQAFVDAVNAQTEKPVTLVFQNEGKDISIELPAGTSARIAPITVSAAGIEFSRATQIVHRSPYAQISDVFVITWRTLASLVSPSSDVGVSMLSGPVGILRVYHQLLSADFRLVLWFTVLLNVNLGILNLLPLPVLDGGHILFAFIEKLRRRPLPLNAMAWINGTFMLMLLGMILYVTFFDSRRWQGENRAENIALERSRYYIAPSFDKPPADTP